MIIDIHAHTSERVMQGLHTVDASLSALRAYAVQHDIARICLMATYFPLKKSGLSNLKLLERVADDPLFLIFGSLNLEEALDGQLAELELLADAGRLAGLKLYPGYQSVETLHAERYLPFFQLAARHALPVAVHLGELHHCCPKNVRLSSAVKRCGAQTCLLDLRGEQARPAALLGVAQRYPEVKFIACHLGNPFFEELREVMRLCPNVLTDCSGQFLSGTAEDSPAYRHMIVEELRRFLALQDGEKRLLFGTDFPIQSYCDTLALIQQLDLTPAQTELVLYRNAANLLLERH